MLIRHVGGLGAYMQVMCDDDVEGRTRGEGIRLSDDRKLLTELLSPTAMLFYTNPLYFVIRICDESKRSDAASTVEEWNSFVYINLVQGQEREGGANRWHMPIVLERASTGFALIRKEEGG